MKNIYVFSFSHSFLGGDMVVRAETQTKAFEVVTANTFDPKIKDIEECRNIRKVEDDEDMIFFWDGDY